MPSGQFLFLNLSSSCLCWLLLVLFCHIKALIICKNFDMEFWLQNYKCFQALSGKNPKVEYEWTKLRLVNCQGWLVLQNQRHINSNTLFFKQFISEVEYGNKIILKPFYFDYFINNFILIFFCMRMIFFAEKTTKKLNDEV